MRLLDLFCGRWGWSRAFAARGWECVGVDLVQPPEIPDGCAFLREDILAWTVNTVKSLNFDFIVTSSPCEEFSVHGMKHFHPNPKYPENGIKLFNHTRQLCEASGVPYVMENVRAAQQFVGRAQHRCGPFYLWGSGVPPLLTPGQGITKNGAGLKILPGSERRKILKCGLDLKVERRAYHRKQLEISQCPDGTAAAATIPPELANCVAEYAERILEQRSALQPSDSSRRY